MQVIDFTESLSSWKTFSGPNLHIDLIYISETVNVDLELDYLHLSKTDLNN